MFLKQNVLIINKNQLISKEDWVARVVFIIFCVAQISYIMNPYNLIPYTNEEKGTFED
jgi:hypothetical protein